MLSIEIISRGEASLINLLESINKQNFKDYEIICVDSSDNNFDENLLKKYKCKLIKLPQNSGHLIARYTAHKFAKGEISLILDSTRILTENALEILNENYYNYDMVILKESSLGKGFWVNQARLIKDISEMQSQRLKDETLAFLLPRFYKSALLTLAFDNLIKNTNGLFSKISYGEHHLIFEECRKLSSSIKVTNEIILSHYEDNSLMDIMKKYYRYGISQKILKKLDNSEVNKFSTHRRRKVPLKMRLKILPITVARTFPFAFGYILGKNRE